MAKFSVVYYETYKKTYEIEAPDEEEAKEELMFRIQNGLEDGPDQCCDSGIENVNELEND